MSHEVWQPTELEVCHLFVKSFNTFIHACITEGDICMNKRALEVFRLRLYKGYFLATSYSGPFPRFFFSFFVLRVARALVVPVVRVLTTTLSLDT